jgi:hypothetical protein
MHHCVELVELIGTDILLAIFRARIEKILNLQIVVRWVWKCPEPPKFNFQLLQETFFKI